MAESLAVELRVGRCPVCLAAIRLPPESTLRSRIRCPGCRNVFASGMMLAPVKNESAIPAAPPIDAVVLGSGPSAGWVLLGIILAVVLAGVTAYGRTLRGPEFLILYAVAWGVLLITSLILRHLWGSEWFISVLACLTFELIGFLRLFASQPADMKKFGFLAVMMIVGGLLFFLRAKGDGDGHGFFGSCAMGCGGSSGCGSGGGGGCGGGCGGCGGCGG